jgi:hypothetical protein
MRNSWGLRVLIFEEMPICLFLDIFGIVTVLLNFFFYYFNIFKLF